MTDIDTSVEWYQPGPDTPMGRLPVRDDPRTLLAAKYMAGVYTPPIAVDWQRQVSQWPMYGNDRIGDCTIAAAGHLIGLWTKDAAGTEALLAEQAIEAAYSAVSGYNPSTGANDNGANCLDVLNYWRGTGVGGHKIGAYVKLDPKNHDQVRQAVNLFGSIYLGVAMPTSAQQETGPGRTWQVGTAAGSWGGHAVPLGQYDIAGLSCITWGQVQRLTWAFFDAYVEEAYAILSPDWLAAGKDPQGFDLAALTADLAAIGHGAPLPGPTPPPAPGPTPPPAGALVVDIDPVLVPKITKAASKQGMSPAEWVNHRLHQYLAV